MLLGQPTKAPFATWFLLAQPLPKEARARERNPGPLFPLPTKPADAARTDDKATDKHEKRIFVLLPEKLVLERSD